MTDIEDNGSFHCCPVSSEEGCQRAKYVGGCVVASVVLLGVGLYIYSVTADSGGGDD